MRPGVLSAPGPVPCFRGRDQAAFGSATSGFVVRFRLTGFRLVVDLPFADCFFGGRPRRFRPVRFGVAVLAVVRFMPGFGPLVGA